eukprot:jgi/Mesen1/8555/ME000489S07941
MQTQAVVPPQRAPQQSGTATWRRTWQTDQDSPIRRRILQQIFLLFQKRKSAHTPEWQQRLPDFVKRLEDALYRVAMSKEEYMDESSLEQRLQQVAKRLAPPARQQPPGGAGGAPQQQQQQHHANAHRAGGQPAGHAGAAPLAAAPSAGHMASAHSTSSGLRMAAPSLGDMMPTPGQVGNSPAHARPAALQGQGQGQHLGMMPTPGSGPGSSKQGSAMGTGGVNGMIPTPGAIQPDIPQQQQQQQHGGVASGQGGYMYPTSTHASSTAVPNGMASAMRKVSATSGANGVASGVNGSHRDVLHGGSSISAAHHRAAGGGGGQHMVHRVPGSVHHQPGLYSGSANGTTNGGMMPVPGLSHAQQLSTGHGQGRGRGGQAAQANGVGASASASSSPWPAPPRPPQGRAGGPQVGGAGAGGSTTTAATAATAEQLAIDPQRALQYQKQQRWLFLLRHASRCCPPPGGSCPLNLTQCSAVRELYMHICRCRDPKCTNSRCIPSKTLMGHHQICRERTCPVCEPVRQQIRTASQQQQQHQQRAAGSAGPSAAAAHAAASAGSNTVPAPVHAPSGDAAAAAAAAAALAQGAPVNINNIPPANGVSDKPHGDGPPTKKLKLDFDGPPSVPVPPPHHRPSAPAAVADVRAAPGDAHKELPDAKPATAAAAAAAQAEAQHVAPPAAAEPAPALRAGASPPDVKPDITKLKVAGAGLGAGAGAQQPPAAAAAAVVKADDQKTPLALVPVRGQGGVGGVASNHHPAGPKVKSKVVGTSLTELFTPDMIKAHIRSLRLWVGQGKLKLEKNASPDGQPRENDCRLCCVEKLFFEPPPIYCTSCGRRIQRNKVYYTFGNGEQRVFCCGRCHSEFRGDSISIEGMQPIPKLKLEKRMNDEETEEAWVQCDSCEKWVHQVCALFNGRRNEGESEYTCPQCCCEQMERGERQPLPSTAVLGAKDLPRTFLSDQLEARLVARLKDERAARATAQGKPLHETPTAEELVIRVVSSVDKKMDTKPRYLGIFSEGEYPAEFPYKSKVVLLFQRIEGVEVCLFGMYVQEFGSDCLQPNQRRVYLSYLDSVKYFRPEVRTVHGEALRTFVYHEILIGYLEYCKKRGFTSCYIWACPPLKGEDYILYCHPEIQKTPQPAKLREWYLAMLRKATSDGIVVEVSNLYDLFFVTGVAESRAKASAARLPYFDGDYWPGAMEDVIAQLQEEEKEDAKRKAQKKGKKGKTATKRAGGGGKSLLQDENGPASTAPMDLQLMHKLGESILNMKEDFIMVHMQPCCTHCRSFMNGGDRWICPQCDRFNLCHRCYELEMRREPKDRHPVLSKDAHILVKSATGLIMQAPTEAVPEKIEDPDEVMESEFFDTRQAFLSLCQGNHYQYDTLRRAKHSSMMVLYHLHNPTAPAFVVSCNMCQREIESGQGWRCETCPDYDVCATCKDGAAPPHQHPLVSHASQPDRNAQSQEGRRQRILEVRKMLELLAHASQCRVGPCPYPKCPQVKALFRHGMNCKVRSAGGCMHCKRMWALLQLHARSCKDSSCRVPRCKDLKEHLRRSAMQMESRRRAAVQEMMRQRAAEAAGTSS